MTSHTISPYSLTTFKVLMLRFTLFNVLVSALSFPFRRELFIIEKYNESINNKSAPGAISSVLFIKSSNSASLKANMDESFFAGTEAGGTGCAHIKTVKKSIK